jgi:Methyltransferase domain
MSLPAFIKDEARRVLRRLPIIGKIARQRDDLRAIVQQLWQPPGHFYSPIPSPTDIARQYGRREEAPAGIALNEEAQLALLEAIGAVTQSHPFVEQPTEGMRYYFRNLAFGPVDALVWSALLRLWRPVNVIEVGSGFSTAVLLDTSERFLSHSVNITLVEPYPALVQSLLKPNDRVHMLSSDVQDVPLAEFEKLRSGDVLFIDSTHVSKSGSDVNFLLFDVLPRLAIGVNVHVHDVFYPFEYPREWATQGRAWNEAYLLRAFLYENPRFEVVLWSSWLAINHANALHSAIPVPNSLRSFWDPASIWLRKRA